MNEPTGQLEEWEWIERYWTGRLSANDHRRFEEMMHHDKRLAQEAESLRVGIQLIEEARLQAHARQTIQRLQDRHRRRRRMLIGWGTGVGMLMAACLAAIVYLAYAPLALPLAESDPGVLRELRRNYHPDSTEHLSLRQKQVFDLFFEGQAYLAEGQAARAARRFEQVLTFPEIRPYFREAAQWHLIVCYLKTGESAKAGRLYQQLIPAGEYEIGRIEQWKVWWHLQRLSWPGLTWPGLTWPGLAR